MYDLTCVSIDAILCEIKDLMAMTKKKVQNSSNWLTYKFIRPAITSARLMRHFQWDRGICECLVVVTHFWFVYHFCTCLSLFDFIFDSRFFKHRRIHQNFGSSLRDDWNVAHNDCGNFVQCRNLIHAFMLWVSSFYDLFCYSAIHSILKCRASVFLKIFSPMHTTPHLE